MAATADIVNFTHARRANKFSKRFHEIEAVDVVADLLAFVAEDAIRTAADGTGHEIRKKPVQLSAGVRRTGQASAAKTNRRHSKITTIFLDENVSRGFGSAEERMLRVIDAHRFGDSRLVLMTRLDFPTLFQLTQRQLVRPVAV